MSDNGQTDMMTTRPQSGAIATRGFGSESMERRDGATVAVAERAKAEIQAMCIMAIQRPRNLDEVRVRLIDHCKRSGFATKARYSKPVGNNSIEGASIRFVETALQEYGNVLPEAVVVYEDADSLRLRVSVHDLERNIKHADEAVITKRVERRFLAKGQMPISSRTNSYGDLVHLVVATDDEVTNKKNAAQSKLIRNLGLRILPADLVDECMDRCVATVKAGVAADPAGKRKELLDAFHALGVKPTSIVEYLGHSLDEMQPAELINLREVYQAIRDGEATWAAVVGTRREYDAEGARQRPVEEKPAGKGVAGVKARLAKRAMPGAVATDPAPGPTALEQHSKPKPVDELDAAFIDIEERLGRVKVGDAKANLAAIMVKLEALPASPERDRLLALWLEAGKP